ncbi:helicase HerA domain-containing protein [Sandarakinorhabdus sp. DWP1-3-1]|uniref:helicase HerA domain-containing protein n=1 Tax=Sandarakinorhabdus sp. DWP1-3-1 TaxID=2804627 RepID=UPI003CF93CFA
MSGPVPLFDLSTAIIGMSGAGKTVSAKVLVEKLLHEQRHTCVIDPTGVWYGLRSDAAGTGPGFGIPIFGGLHGDVPISAHDGAKVARLVIDGPLSAVVDISELRSGQEQRRFVRDFMATIRGKPRTRFHLVIDEADEFAPQTAADDLGYALLEDMIWIAKRGRVHGFVPMLITQRPADIAKSVLSQMQTLIIHQLVAPTDQAPVRAYLKGHATKDLAAQVEQSLAKLKRGERWVYSPAADVLDRNVAPLPVTFDTSRTPEAGESPPVPATLATIDTAALVAALKPAADATVAVQDVAAAGPMAQMVMQQQSKEIAGLRMDIQDAADREARLQWIIAGYQRAERAYHCLVGDVLFPSIPRHDGSATTDPYVVAPLDQIPAQGGGVPEGDDGQKMAPTERVDATAKRQREREAKPPAEKPQVVTAGETATKASPAAIAIADLLDRVNPAKLTWAQAALTGRKATGGNFNAARKWLRDSGRIAEKGELIWSASPAPAGMSREEALLLWQSVLTNPAPRMIEALTFASMSKDALAGRLGCKPTGGNWNNGLAQLRRNGVAFVEGDRVRLANPLPGEMA